MRGCLCRQGGDFLKTRFLFKKMRCSKVLGFRRFRFLDGSSPAFEKTRSHGTDEAGGVHKHLRQAEEVL